LALLTKLGAQIMLSQDVFRIIFDAPTMQILRLALAVVIGNARLTTTVNCIVSAATIAKYVSLSAVPVSGVLAEDVFIPAVGQSCRLVENPRSDSTLTMHFFVREMFTLSFIVAIAWLVEAWMKADVRAMMDLKISTQAETTVRAVLSAMCDAVVDLGCDLCISTPSPMLATVLSRHDPPGDLQGTLLADLMPHADKERFAQHSRASNM